MRTFALMTMALAAFGPFGDHAVSEPVMVQSGLSEGQGWVFLDAGACWAATAGHVVDQNAGASLTGPNGQKGEAESIRVHERLDLAIMKVRGSLEQDCPSSKKGDRDSRPLLKRLIEEGRTVSFERRVGYADDGGSYGVDVIPVEVIAMSDSDQSFTVRTLNPADYVVQSDSGSPVRMRGQGIGEAGLPLGLVIADDNAVDSGFIRVIRMDAVRNFHESMLASRQDPPAALLAPAFTVVEFSGELQDTRCGALNLENKDSACGWRVSRGESLERIHLVIEFPEEILLSGITLDFKDAGLLEGASIRTRTLGADDWSIDRYCPKPSGARSIRCAVGDWPARQIRIVFEGKEFELNSIGIRPKN